MSRIRVTCKAPPVADTTSEGGFPKINGIAATLTDCTAELVDDDGNVHPITGVRRIYFAVAQDGEPAELTLELVDVELDVELDAHGVNCELVCDRVELASQTETSTHEIVTREPVKATE